VDVAQSGPAQGGGQAAAASCAAGDVRERPATFTGVLRIREYRALFFANELSLLGDQFAKIAVPFLIFSITRSASLAATSFAVSFIPWIIGGPLLSAYADRMSRRAVMVVCDLVRMVLTAVMIVPGVPAGALVVPLFMVNLFHPAWNAARLATLPDILPGDRYFAATGLDNIVLQLTQVLGYGGGGVLVALVSARGALAVDAISFAVSAVLIAARLRRHSPAAAAPHGVRGAGADFATGMTVIFRSKTLRAYILLFWLTAGFSYAGEGLAAPLAHDYGGAARLGGVILAAAPCGMVAGGVVLVRLTAPRLRPRLIVPFALLGCASLIPLLRSPPLWLLVSALWLTGFGARYRTELAEIAPGSAFPIMGQK
jgi:MFS family permease